MYKINKDLMIKWSEQMIAWAVLPFAVLALLAGVFIFFQLIRLLGFLATQTVFSVVGVFFGFTLALLLDIKFIALAAGFITYAFSVEGGWWAYYAVALSFYLFVVCSANIVVLLVENLRKTTFGAKLDVLKPFSFDFDSLSDVNKGLPDVLRMGVAFFGGLGLFVAFGLLCFIASHWFPIDMFPGQSHRSLSFGQSFNFALQKWADVIPVVGTAVNDQLSLLKPSWTNWVSRGVMLVTLAFQFLIYPALYNFLYKLWEVSTFKQQVDK